MVATGQARFEIATIHEPVGVVIEVEGERHTDLFEVGEAAGTLAALFGASERREKERRQNGDDGDHDQKLDQGEGVPPLPMNLASAPTS